VGQRYEPVDRETLLYYKEAKDGQILEEGITEAGSMSSFVAAGTAYATHGVNTIPFFTFYSMFGFQRIGDLVWAAGDMRCRGFMMGATAGRTTLAGEGLQHQDGHSHLLALPHPTVFSYDPAFAYELAVIVYEGIRRMISDQENPIYYLTIGNEPYSMPAMPEGSKEGILKGLYRFRSVDGKKGGSRVQLLGSGAIMNQVLKAQEMLAGDYGVGSDVWSVTGYKELFRDAATVERWNMLHPGETPRKPYVQECLGDAGAVVAASDYTKALPLTLARWLPDCFLALGTDGFGRSGSRAALRSFFEVDAASVTVGALYALAREGDLEMKVVKRAIGDLGIDPEKLNPMFS